MKLIRKVYIFIKLLMMMILKFDKLYFEKYRLIL
jgi:hypothetical protein